MWNDFKRNVFYDYETERDIYERETIENNEELAYKKLIRRYNASDLKQLKQFQAQVGESNVENSSGRGGGGVVCSYY